MGGKIGGNMATITMIKTIKQIHPKDVVFVKIGDFYHVYGKDSYIISYLMGYKLNIIEGNCSSCGFPKKSLAKIEATLENRKINYIVVDRRNNYDVDEFSNNKNLNSYDDEFEIAHKYINLKKRIDKIYENLITNIKKEKIKEKLCNIEEILEI